jgi:HEAT repeat protein
MSDIDVPRSPARRLRLPGFTAALLLAACASPTAEELTSQYSTSLGEQRAILVEQLAERPDLPPSALAVFQDASTDRNVRVRFAAVQGLRRFGVAADDELVASMADADPQVAAEAREGVDELGDAAAGALARALVVPLPETGIDPNLPRPQREIFDRLLAIGKDALPDLQYALEDPATALGAAMLIQRLGPTAAPAVRDLRAALLQADHPAQMLAIADALGAIGPDASAASEQLEELLVQASAARMVDDPNTADRLQVALIDAIGRVAPPESRDEAARRIAKYLRPEASPAIRRAAALALGRLAVPETLPDVADTAREDPDPEVRLYAVDALGAAGSQATPYLEMLGGFLRREDAELRAASIRSVSMIGGDTAAARLAPALEDDDNVEQVVGAFAALGESSVPVLRQGLERASSRRTAILALTSLRQSAAPAVDDLVEVVRTSRGESRELAGRALSAIGAPAVPALVLRLQKGEDDLPTVQRALARIGEPAVAPLVECFTQDPLIERNARTVLIEMGARAVPALVDQLKIGNSTRAVVRTLGWIGEDARGAVAGLQALAERDPSLAPDVEAALRKIAPLRAGTPTESTGEDRNEEGERP